VQAIALIKHAVDQGVTLFNTATFYGPLNEPGFGANLRLLNKCFAAVDRSKIQIMCKICMDTRAPVEKTGQQWIMRGDAASIAADVDYALKTLGVEYLDIAVMCRVPQDVSIEEVMKGLVAQKEAGKIRHIGLSEANGEILRRAHAVHPVYCIEQEWSMWTRDIEAEIVPVCRELGIKIVAYSPLGRGFLTGSIRDRNQITDPYDYRLFGQPRFAADNMATNLKLVDDVASIANAKGCTVGQLALAWLHAQGDDVIPIPGTSKIAHFDSNLAARHIKLSAEELEHINKVFTPTAAVGDRYAHMALTFHGNPKAGQAAAAHH
jgi:aryl-alcohol dehydrogenase-like predicted oxidoreductase